MEELGLSGPSRLLRSTTRRKQIWVENWKEIQEITRMYNLISGLSSLRVKNKNGVCGRESSWQDLESRYIMYY